ncbi:FeoA family protein [Thermovirga sp.]|uniref:FeoA family protein n=1 Tax=Thermovirga sp. TaxID=2699834 RepID=UPI0025D0BB9B|nr:FeoA family protein [Thermovirga sp.]MBO8153868.1 ferrous iron transport protein A [Thermovirga sp.]
MSAKLHLLKNGQKAKIVSLPPGLCGRRIEALGLRPGKIIEKVSGMPFRGPITISLDGRQIAIGHGMSERIIIEPLDKKGEKL